MDEKYAIKEQIKNSLIEQGSYTPSLDLLIDTCAEVTVLKSKAFDCAKRKKTTAKEKSRENEFREKPHPAHVIYMDYVEAQRKELNELCLTAKTLSFANGDEVDDLVNDVNKIDRDGEGD